MWEHKSLGFIAVTPLVASLIDRPVAKENIAKTPLRTLNGIPEFHHLCNDKFSAVNIVLAPNERS